MCFLSLCLFRCSIICWNLIFFWKLETLSMSKTVMTSDILVSKHLQLVWVARFHFPFDLADHLEAYSSTIPQFFRMFSFMMYKYVLGVLIAEPKCISIFCYLSCWSFLRFTLFIRSFYPSENSNFFSCFTDFSTSWCVPTALDWPCSWRHCRGGGLLQDI